MTVRMAVILAIVSLPLAGIGCSPPESERFVDGKRTKELAPKAAAEIRKVVDSYFGSPHHLVASLELPVEFGEIRGKVVESEAEFDPHQVAVELQNADIPAEQLKDLGLVWKSGDYQEAVYTATRNNKKAGITKGDEFEADFHVTGFTPSGDEDGLGVLSLNYKLETPPKPGAEFIIVGHRLRSGRQLYMQHCMHCHGYSGDGAGPTAKYLNPLPRDYRLGIFKFTSTLRPDKPSREDLKQILKEGIPGTYMPSFLLLEDDELQKIVEYVRWLSMRGEFEQILANGMEFTDVDWKRMSDNAQKEYEEALERWNKRKRGDEPTLDSFKPEGKLAAYVNDDLPDQIETAIKIVHDKWSEVENPKTRQKRIVRPTKKRFPADADSIARGRALYLSTATNCWTCHGVTGNGDGPQTTSYQKNLKDPAGGEYPEPGLYNDWGDKIQPRNLTRGIYRGGRRPIDLYRRVKVGIKGTPMPSFGTLTDQQIWDIVNYVLSIPVQKGHADPGKPRASGKKMASD